MKIQLIILVIIICSCSCSCNFLEWYPMYNTLPYKCIPEGDTRKILIGLPSINRDSGKCSRFYKSLMDSMRHLYSKCKGVEIKLLVVTRVTDDKIISFWKDKPDVDVITVPHYTIEQGQRHNMNMVSSKFNLLADYSTLHDALVIIESDVYIKKNTLYNLIKYLKVADVAFAYGDIPWANKPVVVVPGMFHPEVTSKVVPGSTVLGSWTGAVAIRPRVFKTCRFKVDVYNGIVGQDVGFYKQLFKNRYKVVVADDVYHDY